MSFTRQEALNGFMLVSEKLLGLQKIGVKAGVTIVKGDCIGDDGSGFAQLETALDGLTLGIAAESVDNVNGSDGTLNVQYIPIEDPKAIYVVANESATAAAQTDVSETVDLESEDGVDVTDVTVTANGFKIMDVDTTNDYVKGRFIAIT